MGFTTEQIDIIKRCQQSCNFFLRNFGKIKHPSAGILPFYPFSYQRNAIKAFRENRLNIFRKCMAEGSMVWTPKGPIPIEQVKPGDLVYSYDEASNSIRVNKVINSWSSGYKQTYEVRTKTGHRSYATEDHPYKTDSGWVEAVKLTANDRLIEIYDPVRYGQANQHEAILLGYLLTDGSYSRDNRSDFHFTNTRWKYLLDYQKHFEKRFNERLTIKLHNKVGQHKSKKTSYRVTSHAIEAKLWLRELGISGDKAATKKIPECVFSWDNKYIALLLNRMYAGDGWYSGSHCNEVGIGSESVLMLHQIKQLLTRFQIDSKFYPATKKGIAKLRIYGTENFKRFVEKIGIFGKKQRHNPITSGFFNQRDKGAIKSIKTDLCRSVYDLEVENDHNFIVDGVVVHNCRQAGASKVAGAFALWFGMFYPNKKILIVSRKNDDAMGFLRENIVFPFNNLPDWMKQIYEPPKINEHEIVFPNNSHIQSLTSHPDVLRSHASSLNILDEVAFIPQMDAMWASGWPTLQHGGSVIAISTTNGVGGWYWSTMTQAEAGLNSFNPIVINWWDMDWAIEYQDALTKKLKRIAPRDGIRECRTKAEIERYGPYWSPWLEEQWQALQAEGEGWKFEQEILARFVGSGNTILDKGVLAHITTTVREPSMKVRENQTYVHPVSGENIDLNFTFEDEGQGLWIYRQPVLAKPAKMRGNSVIEHGSSAHAYVMGVDISTGKGRDYCAIEVFDVDTREQVAEFMARVLPRELAMYADMIGRFYNSAMMVVERNNGGDIIIDELRYTYMYPRLWRKKEINDKPVPMSARRRKSRPLKVGTYGFMTTSSSKPSLNKLLVDFIRDTEDGWVIYSSRLLNQFQTYVRKRDRAGKDTNKTEAEEGANNFDDLVMATGLAFVGANDAIMIDSSNLLPTGSNTEFKSTTGPTIMTDITKIEVQQDISSRGGPSLLMPMTLSPDEVPEVAAQRILDSYTVQLGGIPISQGRPLVTPSKYFYDKK